MNRTGDGISEPQSRILILARAALLDALEALGAHRDAVVVIGAQAIYLQTRSSSVALAEATKDSDLALDPRSVEDDPRIEEAMTAAGFTRDEKAPNPGAWINDDGIPVDLMVPEALAGGGKKNARGARIPPHASWAARRAVGLEAAVVSFEEIDVVALDSEDHRVFRARVASKAALLVAKLHKLGERATGSSHRLNDKDAHDVYRILVDSKPGELADELGRLQADALAGEVTRAALVYLAELFAPGPDAIGSEMAGRAESLVGDPDTVATSTSVLAQELLASMTHDS